MSRTLFVMGLVVAGLASSANSAQAWGRKKCCYDECYTPCCEMKTEYIDKVVTCYRPEWKERQVSCTINRMIPREVVETKVCTVLVPEFHEEQRTCFVTRMVPHEVEKEVTCCKWVRECCVDPCTGCCKTVRHKVTEVHLVKSCVYECVKEPREYTVRVCTMKPVQKTIECRRIVCECKPEVVVRNERYCVMVPYQTTVKVAVCKPVCAETVACCH